jgi:hypothetical protein
MFARSRKVSDADDFASWAIIKFLESPKSYNLEWLLIHYLRQSRGNIRTEAGRAKAYTRSLDAPIKDGEDTPLSEFIGAPDPEPDETEVRDLALSMLPARARPLAELCLDGLPHGKLRIICRWREWRESAPTRIKLALAKAKVQLELREAEAQ